MNPLTWLSVKEWIILGAFVALFAYHEWDKHEAVKTATSNLQDRVDNAAKQAVIDAQTEWHQTASGLDMLTYLDRQQYAAQIEKISASVSNLKKEYHDVAVKTPLPADCRASPDRVRSVNRALSGEAGPVPGQL